MITSNIPSNSLSIRFSSDGFSLYIFDDNKQLISSKTIEFEMLKQTEDDLLNILDNTLELKLSFKSIQLIYETNQYSFIPDKLFDKENIRYFLHLQHPDSQKTEHFAYNQILAWDIYIAFAVPNNLYQVLLKILPDIELEHHIYTFVNEKIPIQKLSAVFVIDRNDTIDIIALEKGIFQLVNSYKYTSTETALYFILKVYEQLKLDVNQCVTFLNTNKSNSSLELLIKTYIKNYAIC
jgi:hypothetical protein